MNSIKKREYIHDLLKKWFKVASKTEGYKVAIARKGPRLLEYCLNEYPGTELNGTVVSNHAIPFIVPTCSENITIMDEAIYFGSTYEVVKGAILAGLRVFDCKVNPSNIKDLPVVVSEVAKERLNFSSFDVYKSENQIINKEAIPYYINYFLTDLQKLGRPYDMEFPIFHLTLKQEFLRDTDKKNIYNNLQDIVRNCLDKLHKDLKNESGELTTEQPYSSKHINNISETQEKPVYKAWTLLFDDDCPDKEYLIHSEFKKMRVFVSAETPRINMIFFAPHVFSKEVLTEDSRLFKGTYLESIWRIIYRGAPAVEYAESFSPDVWDYLVRKEEDKTKENITPEDYGYYRHMWEQQVFEYEEMRIKSLIIMANYLLSFNLFLSILENIKSSFAKFFSFDTELLTEKDLVYLLGPELGRTVCFELKKLIRANEVEKYGFRLYINKAKPVSSYSYIPRGQFDEFKYHNNRDLAECQTLSELLSCNFSNHRKYLELASRNKYDRFQDRLSYGESFTSMLSKFQLYDNKNKLYKRIHQGIDWRIDNGSIVPKYVEVDGNYLRLFRSGENMDKNRDQLERVIRSILGGLCKEYNSHSLPERMIQLAFNLLLGIDKKGEEVVGLRFKTKVKDFDYQTYFIEEDIEDEYFERNLLEYCIAFRILEEDEEDDLFYRYLENPDYETVFSKENYNILNEEQENKIKLYTKIVVLLTRNLGISSFSKVARNLVDFQPEPVYKLLNDLFAGFETLKKEVEQTKTITNITFLKPLTEVLVRSVKDKIEPEIEQIEQIKQIEITHSGFQRTDFEKSVDSIIQKIRKTKTEKEKDEYTNLYNSIKLWRDISVLLQYKMTKQPSRFTENSFLSLNKYEKDNMDLNTWIISHTKFIETPDDKVNDILFGIVKSNSKYERQNTFNTSANS